jgi:hypothetical protein
MSKEDSLLNSLVVDEDTADQEVLSSILHPYLRIGGESGRLIFESAYEDLRAKEKVLIVLAAQLAKVILGMEESAWLSPSKISKQGGIKKGTVDPTVRDLYGDGLLDGEDGRYRIPRTKLHEVEKLLDIQTDESSS